MLQKDAISFVGGLTPKISHFRLEKGIIDLKGLLPVTGYDDEPGHLSPLRNVGRALMAEGDSLYARGKVEEAVQAYEAAVILGARMVEGRES